MSCDPVEPPLSQKVEFLRSISRGEEEFFALETNMSWVFLSGDRVLKLKKPVTFPFLDFSTLARREAACRAELALNRSLAPDVYLAVVPLRAHTQSMSLNGEGHTVDWLVAMRRLDQQYFLDHVLQTGTLNLRSMDHVGAALARFYRSTPRPLPSAAWVRGWEQKLHDNSEILLLRRFDLPSGLVRRIDRIQRQFLVRRRQLLLNRVRGGRIVEGHGDLRPEHIWLGNPPQVIDRLEFNRSLRLIDPFDEIAFLSVECERLGAAWIGARLVKKLEASLQRLVPPELFSFYRCYRATMRARLTIAHLLSPAPRMPEQWLPVALEYLRIADREALHLATLLSRRSYA